MKRILLFVLVASFFAGCNKIDKDSFRISGKLTNGIEKQLVLMEMTGQGLMPIYNINLDKNGEFKFTYKLTEPGIFVLMANPNDYITFIPQKQEDIIINGFFNSFSNTYTIQNSKESELLHDLNKEYIRTNAILAEINQTLHENKYAEDFEEIRSQLLDRYTILELHQKEVIKKFLNNNKGSLACIIGLYRSFDNHYLFNLNSDLDVYEGVYSEMLKTYPNNKHTIGLKKLIDDTKEKKRLKEEGLKREEQEPKKELANKR
ncbi:MAG: DUF4369 domain-containing protein [Bacteroidales bacterium]|nr:DUF4369 domain-containing protein [Bacteroidales bacterium]MDD4684572.1 DUF4369 domain-containing protein [Bacteroidales bacterium]